MRDGKRKGDSPVARPRAASLRFAADALLRLHAPPMTRTPVLLGLLLACTLSPRIRRSTLQRREACYFGRLLCCSQTLYSGNIRRQKRRDVKRLFFQTKATWMQQQHVRSWSASAVTTGKRTWSWGPRVEAWEAAAASLASLCRRTPALRLWCRSPSHPPALLDCDSCVEAWVAPLFPWCLRR